MFPARQRGGVTCTARSRVPILISHNACFPMHGSKLEDPKDAHRVIACNGSRLATPHGGFQHSHRLDSLRAESTLFEQLQRAYLALYLPLSFANLDYHAFHETMDMAILNTVDFGQVQTRLTDAMVDFTSLHMHTSVFFPHPLSHGHHNPVPQPASKLDQFESTPVLFTRAATFLWLLMSLQRSIMTHASLH